MEGGCPILFDSPRGHGPIVSKGWQLHEGCRYQNQNRFILRTYRYNDDLRFNTCILHMNMYTTINTQWIYKVVDVISGKPRKNMFKTFILKKRSQATPDARLQFLSALCDRCRPWWDFLGSRDHQSQTWDIFGSTLDVFFHHLFVLVVPKRNDEKHYAPSSYTKRRWRCTFYKFPKKSAYVYGTSCNIIYCV